MNKKLLIVIGILVILIIAMGSYIVGTKSTNNDKNETTKSKSTSSHSTKVSSSSSSSSSAIKANLSTADAESQLNNGQNIDGKIVDVEIFEAINSSELGQNLQAGEHLNFYPATQQYNLKAGDHVKFKVEAAKDELGSWLIKGDVVK